MKLIVGLGNPGLIYRGSRHNIGFRVVKALARAKRIALKKEKGISSLSAKASLDGCEVLLSLPLTYMNLFGSAVNGLIKKYKIEPATGLLVVCDDLDLGLGRIKIRASGSSGGHRGLRSIIEALKTEEFARLRVGIGRPVMAKSETSKYVLSPFAGKE